MTPIQDQESGDRSYDAAFAYTVASGRLFLPMAEFQRRAEWILDRPIWTHEFGDPDTWTDLREALEETFTAAFGPSVMENSP